jgi:hypothetical protein
MNVLDRSGYMFIALPHPASDVPSSLFSCSDVSDHDVLPADQYITIRYRVVS